jgi:hypothetical protein
MCGSHARRLFGFPPSARGADAGRFTKARRAREAPTPGAGSNTVFKCRQLRSAFAFGSAGVIVVSVDGDVLFDMLGVVGVVVSEAAGGVALLSAGGVVAAGVSVVAGGLDDCDWA